MRQAQRAYKAAAKAYAEAMDRVRKLHSELDEDAVDLVAQCDAIDREHPTLALYEAQEAARDALIAAAQVATVSDPAWCETPVSAREDIDAVYAAARDRRQATVRAKVTTLALSMA